MIPTIFVSLATDNPTTLDHAELKESSGVAQGTRERGVIWSHNDSGDTARLFAFDRKGKHLGVAAASDLKARDWEDMCAFDFDDKHLLAVGDVGDNLNRRESVQVHVFVEPDWKDLKSVDETARPNRNSTVELKRLLTLEITYEHGPANCEGIAYDPLRHSIVLATKENFRCRLYEVPLPKRLKDASKPQRQSVEAEQTQALVLPLVTGLDISADGTEMVFCTYGPGVMLTRRNGSEPWSHKLGLENATFPLPPRKQGESICFTRDASTVLLTSEFAPCPLLEVNVPDQSPQD